MANDEHVAMLRKGVGAWNEWRHENPDIKPDLAQANLFGGEPERGGPERGEPDLGEPEWGGPARGEPDLGEPARGGPDRGASCF
jgi:hypothetical protein